MRAKIYMKSGNVITAWGIKTIAIKYEGDSVTSLTIRGTRTNTILHKIGIGMPWLMVESINLSQIEAITTN